MRINTYLSFDGDCQEAISFYQEVFGQREVKILRYGDVPPTPDFPLPEEAKKLILHAEMPVGEDIVYFSDNFPGSPFDKRTGDIISVTLGGIDAQAARVIYDKLTQGGKELMAMDATFFSPAYGMLIDKFGVKWLISAEK